MIVLSYHELEDLPMSLTFFCVSLLNLLKNGFSWVSRILTSSMQTFIILAWMNGYRVYIPCIIDKYNYFEMCPLLSEGEMLKTVHALADTRRQFSNVKTF